MSILGFIDDWIEEKLYQKFSKRRLGIIEKMLETFFSTHPNLSDKDRKELIEKIAKEDIRVHAITDRSLLRAGIHKAKYVFLGAATATVIVVGSLGAFSSGSITPFVTPLASAFVSWVASIATIEISFEQRVKAGYDTAMANYDPEMQELEKQTSAYLLQRFLRQPQNTLPSSNVLSIANVNSQDSKIDISSEEVVFHADVDLQQPLEQVVLDIPTPGLKLKN